MEVVKIKGHKVTINFSEEEYSVLMRGGLRELVEEEYKGKILVLPPSQAPEGCKTVELGDDIADWLVQRACLTGIKRMMEREK